MRVMDVPVMQSRQSFGVPGLLACGVTVTIVLLITFYFLSENRQAAASFTILKRKFYHSQTFHNYFLKGIETASAFTKLDADMKRDKRIASVALVAFTTLALAGCGADDSASNAASLSPTASAAASNTAQRAALSPAAPMPGAPSAMTANPAAASDPIAQNMQASLGADSQQVTPVMHYAPGDSATSN